VTPARFYPDRARERAGDRDRIARRKVSILRIQKETAMRHLRRTTIAALLPLLFGSAAAAQTAGTEAEKVKEMAVDKAKEIAADKAMEMAKDMAKPAAGVRADILAQIDDAEKKLLALAEATPADKFGWRPAEGVRTAGQVYAHVAGGNYFLMTFWGAKAPAGVDPRSFEAAAGDKAATIQSLRQSFEHVRGEIAKVSDADLDKPVEMFGRQSTVRGAMLTVASHAHEHLGQAIAYARSSGIVPPWSRQDG
jgi:uncharacterized damage-inducible protein DinB